MNVCGGSAETLVAKISSRLDLAHRLQFAVSVLEALLSDLQLI